MQGRFTDFCRKQSDWLTLQPGEEIANLIWTGEAKETVDKWGKPAFIFTFKLPDESIKKYTISTLSVLKQFDNYQPNDVFTIRRKLEGKPKLEVIKTNG